jgi:iron complex outermembrane receptor protein
VSEQWATLFQDESRGDRIDARDIVNAQIAWTHDSWVTTLYCNNLTDQHYVGAINSGLRFAGPPRQYGLRVNKSF